MALELDPVTGCLPSPPMLHDATAAQAWEAFVAALPDSRTRPMIWSAYGDHWDQWTPLLGSLAREQWIDGSFTTSKPDPEDVVGRLFRGPSTPRGEPCHAFAVPVAAEGTPEMTTTMALRTFFLEWFGNARPEEGGHAKGIVRLWVGEER